jgi:hypothetical protein
MTSFPRSLQVAEFSASTGSNSRLYDAHAQHTMPLHAVCMIPLLLLLGGDVNQFQGALPMPVSRRLEVRATPFTIAQAIFQNQHSTPENQHRRIRKNVGWFGVHRRPTLVNTDSAITDLHLSPPPLRSIPCLTQCL